MSQPCLYNDTPNTVPITTSNPHLDNIMRLCQPQHITLHPQPIVYTDDTPDTVPVNAPDTIQTKTNIHNHMDTHINMINNQPPLTITVLSLNVCGIKGKLLSEEFCNLCKRYDILCMNETRCDDVEMVNVSEKMESIGFDVVYKNRSELSKFKSGGIIIAIKNDSGLKWKYVKNNYEAFMSVKIIKNSK